MSTTHQVTIGDQSFTIQRFRGLKAILAIAAVTRVGRAVPNIMSEAAREFQRENMVTVTEDMTGLPQFNGFTKADFDNAQARTGKREIKLPQPMDNTERILQSLPALLEGARQEVVRLFAILITPNEELKVADKAGQVEEVLDKHADLLLYEAEIDQLADLALAAQDVIKEQLEDRKDRLGNLIRGVATLLRGRSTPQIQKESESEKSESQPPTSPTSTNGAPSSSTASPPPTDGTPTPSSTELSGVA